MWLESPCLPPICLCWLLLCSAPGTGPGRKACSTFPGLSLAVGPAPAPGRSADGMRSGGSLWERLAWLAEAFSWCLPGAERGSRHRGIQAACSVYKKPSGAPSWDCSHLFALFPCKMLLTVLHQGQFILNGMYRHSIHLYFLPTLLFPPCFWSYIWFWERKPFSIWGGKKELTALKRNLPS